MSSIVTCSYNPSRTRHLTTDKISKTVSSSEYSNNSEFFLDKFSVLKCFVTFVLDELRDHWEPVLC